MPAKHHSFNPTHRLLFIGGVSVVSLVLAQLSMLLGGSAWWVPATILLAGTATWFIFVDRRWSEAIVPLLFWLLGCLVASLTFDNSWDGMWYHKNAVIALADGWSPYREPHWELWGRVYPMGHWIWDASFYKLTGFMGAAHATNFFFLFTMVWCLTPLLRAWGVAGFKAPALAFLICFNSITLAQLATGYIDGTMGLGLIATLLLLVESYRRRSIAALVAAAMWLSFSSSMKFTGWVYSGVIAAAIAGTALYYLLRRTLITDRQSSVPLTPNDTQWGQHLLLTAAGIGVLVLLVNAQPLTNNWRQGQHPLWPLFGNNTVTILQGDASKDFYALGLLRRPLYSVFARTNNSPTEFPELKIPGQVHHDEWQPFVNPDTRFGGFGPLFSLALVLSIGVTLVFWKTQKRQPADTARPLHTSLIWTALIITLGLFCIHPWWARYAAFWWLIPLLPVIFFITHTRSKTVKMLSLMVYAVLFINAAGVGRIAWFNAREASKEWTQFRQVVSTYSCLNPHRLISAGQYFPMTVSYARALKDSGIEISALDQQQSLPRDAVEVARMRDRITIYCVPGSSL